MCTSPDVLQRELREPPGTNTRPLWIVSEQAQWLGEVPQQWSKANDTPVSRRGGMKMQGATSQSASPRSLSDDGVTANLGNHFQTCEGREGIKESRA